MTRTVKYAQCAMRRIVAGASVVTTSYIPTQFAKVGRVLKLKDSDDRWVDGWVVETVGDVIVEGDRVPTTARRFATIESRLATVRRDSEQNTLAANGRA